MAKKKITMDYYDYLKMLEKIDNMEKALKEDGRIYTKKLDAWTWSYSYVDIPKCINDFIRSTKAKDFKKLKKELN